MYFALIDFYIKKNLKEFSLLTFSFKPKESGTRNLISFRWERNETSKVFNIHFLWNWNHVWYKSLTTASTCAVAQVKQMLDGRFSRVTSYAAKAPRRQFRRK